MGEIMKTRDRILQRLIRNANDKRREDQRKAQIFTRAETALAPRKMKPITEVIEEARK